MRKFLLSFLLLFLCLHVGFNNIFAFPFLFTLTRSYRIEKQRKITITGEKGYVMRTAVVEQLGMGVACCSILLREVFPHVLQFFTSHSIISLNLI